MSAWDEIVGEPGGGQCCNGGNSGDSWDPGWDPAELALAKAVKVAREVVGDYDASEGYGHHSGYSLVIDTDGVYHYASCGGCSCGGSGSYEGPLEGLDDGRLSQHLRTELKLKGLS